MAPDYEALEILHKRLLLLACWTVHDANTCATRAMAM